MQMSTAATQVQAGISKFNSTCTSSLPQLSPSPSPSLCWLAVLFCSLRAKSVSLVAQHRKSTLFLFRKTKSGFVWCCSLKCVSLAWCHTLTFHCETGSCCDSSVHGPINMKPCMCDDSPWLTTLMQTLRHIVAHHRAVTYMMLSFTPIGSLELLLLGSKSGSKKIICLVFLNVIDRRVVPSP